MKGGLTMNHQAMEMRCNLEKLKRKYFAMKTELKENGFWFDYTKVLRKIGYGFSWEEHVMILESVLEDYKKLCREGTLPKMYPDASPDDGYAYLENRHASDVREGVYVTATQKVLDNRFSQLIKK